ncbi:hypothetical protein INR49_012723, partial [Caranx melampygus]
SRKCSVCVTPELCLHSPVTLCFLGVIQLQSDIANEQLAAGWSPQLPGLPPSPQTDTMLPDERIWSLLKRHCHQTLTYWSVFFSFGLCIAFLGPTILDLRCQTHSTLHQITWVFFAQQFFLLVGSSMGGLCKKTPTFSLSALLASTLIISLVFATIPLCYHVRLLAVAMVLAGTAMGMIDTIANVQLVKLYQKDSAIFLQALHFFIGLGALVSPLVVGPFLSDDSCILSSNWTVNSSSSLDLQHLRSSLAGHGTALHNISQYSLHTEGVVITRVSYAFWIMALINLPVPTAVLVLMYHERLLPCFSNSPRLLDRDSVCSTNPTGDSGQGHGTETTCCNFAKLRGRPATFFILHALGGLSSSSLMELYVFLLPQGSYAGFVYTYAVSPPLLMGHKTAAYLDSIFWASITAGRLAFIYLSYKYAAPRLLIFSLCSATCDPSSCATTVLVTSASTGEMLLQQLVGSVIQSRGSYAFLLCCTISSFIGFCLFLLLLYVQRIHTDCHTGKHTPDSSKNTDMKENPQTEGS